MSLVAGEDNSIRSFYINVPAEQLVDLRRRLAATRWPDRETVTDRSQGVQLATMKELVRYWETDYDWRKAESKLNALPQFVTNIDGLDIPPPIAGPGTQHGGGSGNSVLPPRLHR